MIEKEDMNEIFKEYKKYDRNMDLIHSKVWEIHNIIEGKMDEFYTIIHSTLNKYFSIDKTEENYREIKNIIFEYLYSEEYKDKDFEDLEKEIQLIRGKNNG